MNRYTFVLPSENQKAFRLLSICANTVYNVIQSPKDISSIKIFCKDIHESLKYVDELSELTNDEFQKEHASLSLESTQSDAHDKMGFQYISISVDIRSGPMRGSRGETGSGPPPLKNHKNIEFLSYTGQDPLKFSKTTKPAFNVGSSSARQQVFRWRADDGPLL